MMARSIPTLQPFDPAAVGATFLLPQGGINRTTITLTAAAMGLQDHGKERRWELERPLTSYSRWEK
jgi:hypothetical protein